MIAFLTDGSDIALAWADFGIDNSILAAAKEADNENHRTMQQTMSKSYRSIAENYGKIQSFVVDDLDSFGGVTVYTGLYRVKLLDDHKMSKNMVILDFLCGSQVVCAIYYVRQDGEAISALEWDVLGEFLDSVSIHLDVAQQEITLGDSAVTVKYPPEWEVEENRDDLIGFIVGSSQLLVFHYYPYEVSISRLIALKESNSPTWTAARQQMEEYASEWVLSHEWTTIEENPIDIRWLGQQQAICQEDVVEAELSRTRTMRTLTCEFDCADYICGINYVRFGADLFEQDEIETVERLVDSIEIGHP